MWGDVNSVSCLKSSIAELTGHRDRRQNKTQTQTTSLGAAAGLNQSARANQPSKLCDHQPTADYLEHH